MIVETMNNIESEARMDSAQLFKDMVSFGSTYGIMNESASTEMPVQQPAQNQFIPQQPQMYQYQMPTQPVQPSYDPMAEFDTMPEMPAQSGYVVSQEGTGANTRFNVKDSRTGQVYASCILEEASQKIANLMNQGKMFTDMEVMKCVMADTKFNQHIQEMRKIKADIEMPNLNESAKSSLINKLNEMKMEAINIKKKIAL